MQCTICAREAEKLTGIYVTFMEQEIKTIHAFCCDICYPNEKGRIENIMQAGE